MAKVNALIIDTVKRFLSKLKEQGIHIESAYIFVSYVKGTENAWSDIDVAVISSDITDDRLEDGQIEEDLQNGKAERILRFQENVPYNRCR